MSTIQELLNAAVLADAAYLNITVVPGTSLSGAALTNGLIEAAVAIPRPFSQTEAELISSQYDLVASSIASGVGFQALVFQKHGVSGQPGEFVLAIRGTESVVDIAADIALELVAAAGGQDGALLQFVDRLARPLAQGGYGLALPAGSLDATGHSLGGHLVKALVSAQPSLIHAGYTFNGAGLGLNLTNPAANVALALQAAWVQFGGVATKVTNVIGEAGLDIVPSALTGPKVGDIAELFTESQTLPWDDHSMGTMVDSLMVYRAFEALVGTTQFGMATVTGILRAASSSPLASLESVLNSLAGLFPVSQASSTVAVGDRGALHQAADRLVSHLTGPGGGGGTFVITSMLQSSTKLVTAASQGDAQGLAYRYALVNGIPFVVGGVDYDALFNSSGRYDAANFSTEYLTARAQYLAAQFDANTRDSPFSPGIAPDLVYRDLASATTLGNVTLPDVANSRQVVFGDDLMDDVITGGGLSDQLFGGGGNDTLDGGAGNDLLDGGAGNDILQGGGGVTTARGGLGNDTYRYYSGDGLLNISDSQGANLISINLPDRNYVLGNSSLTKVSDTADAWTDAHGNRFVLSNATLHVQLEDGGALAIENFASGDFGISLGGTAPVTPPVGTSTFTVGAPNQNLGLQDETSINGIGRYWAGQGWWSPGAYYHRHDAEIIEVSAAIDDPANHQYPIAYTYGGMGDSYIYGDGETNVIFDDVEGHWDDAVQDPLDPLNYLILGEYQMADVMGDDHIEAGGGNDIVITRGGDDTVLGGDGDDFLVDEHYGWEARFEGPISYFYGSSREWIGEPGHSSNDKMLGGAGNDFIAAQAGSQIMDGGADNDELFAGMGNDQLIGGGGDDVLAGDVYLAGSALTYVVAGGDTIAVLPNKDAFTTDALTYGADILDGGIGNDTLLGGGGNDELYGGDGNDRLQGDYVKSYADLRPGLQAILDPAAVHGNDKLCGGAGNDELWGGGGADYLDGGADSDSLYAGSGDDVLYGGSGDDTLIADNTTGAPGDDELHGGDGADVLYGMGGDDQLDGGAGDDTLSGGAGGTTIDSGNDVLTGGAGVDLLYGQDGNDTLDGGEGYDELWGDAGNDVLIAGTGGDTLNGGEGDDTFRVSSGAGYIWITDDSGANRIVFDATFSAQDVRLVTQGASITLSAGSDIIRMSRSTLDALTAIEFSDGTSFASWNELVDELYRPRVPLTNPVNDPYYNVVQLGAGVNSSEIGYAAFNDDLVITYSGQQANWVDTTALTNKGALVTVRPGSYYGMSGVTSTLVLHNWFAGGGNEYLGQLRFSNGQFQGFSSTAATLPHSYAGTDGADAISGTGAGDMLNGNAGGDLLVGDAGDDVLSGGAGTDGLMGGTGNDVYVFNVGDGADVLFEEAGADGIQFGAGITSSMVAVSSDGEDVILTIGNAANGDSIRIANWLGSDEQIVESIRFSDNSTWSQIDVEQMLPGNHRPHLLAPIASQIAPREQAFSFAIPVGTFADANPGDALTYAATLADGSALPSWLTFSPATQTSSGTPGINDGAVMQLRVRATDPSGLGAEGLFSLRVPSPQTMTGTSDNDVLSALTDDDHTISGLGGTDTLAGGVGNDTLIGGTGNDTLAGGAGSDTYVYNPGDGSDTITATLDAAPGSVDAIQFGAGINPTDVTIRYSPSSGDDILELRVRDPVTGIVTTAVKVREGFDPIDGASILDAVRFTDETTWTRADLYSRYLTGTPLDDSITGLPGDDTITGGAGSDRLTGGAGNDAMSGGAGNDRLNGEAGDDTYYFGRAQGTDLVVDAGGVNQIVLDAGIAPADVTLYRTSSRRAGVRWDDADSSADQLVIVLNTGEQLWVSNFFGSQSPPPISQIVFSTGTVWSAATINANAVTLDGSVNALTGTSGNDQFTVDNSGDTITETAGGGTDSVSSSVTYTLPANVENLTLTGVLALAGVGNTLANSITGNSKDNVLDGGAGNDVLTGGGGDDTYVVDTTDVGATFWDQSTHLYNFTDTVIESAGEGYDTIVAKNVYSASLPNNTEKLVATGIVTDSIIFTPAVDDVRRKFVGNSADNIVDASLISNAGLGVGYSRLWSQGGFDLSEIVIDGGAGADTLIGSAYNIRNRFVVDSLGDVIVLNSNRTDDTVEASISYTLGTGLENIWLTGSAAISGTGNATDNWLVGCYNTAANALTGGAGNDTYVIADGDIPVELTGGGNDTVVIAMGSGSATYSLSNFANVENLRVERGSTWWTININGTDSDNILVGDVGPGTIRGYAGNDLIDGDAGDDTMIGGTGDDTYVVSDAGDVVTELVGEGIDTVQSSVTFALGANVENLTLTGNAAIDGTGNALDNVLSANAGTNTLTGGAGNDTYIVDSSADVVVEAAAEGVDVVTSSASYTLSANVENLTLTGWAGNAGTGNGLDNVLVGNSGANVLDGLLGADVMGGGLGNDTYVVDHTGDMVVEAAGWGSDTVLSAISYVLGADLENLTLTGTDAIDATGNAAANVLTGNAGVNVLTGGAGDDTYVTNDTTDSVIELADEGTDSVQSSASVVLSANVENLTLTGAASIDGTGNEQSNILTGNSGINVLAGGDGNDTYVVSESGDVIVEYAGQGYDEARSSASYALSANVEALTLTGTGNINASGNGEANLLTGNDGANVLDGDAGADVMTGGLGSDVYVVDNAGDVVSESSSGGTDAVMSSISYVLGDNVENLTLIGTEGISATGNGLNNVIVGNAAGNTLDGGGGADTLSGGLGDDVYVLGDALDTVVEAAGEGTDTVRTSQTHVLGTNLENLVLLGSTAINGTGNALDNVISGNSGANTLDGGSGTDTLSGGLGDDTYLVDNSADVVLELGGQGLDSVSASATYTLADNVENLTLTGSASINATGNQLNNVITGNTGANVLDGGLGADTMTGGTGNDTYIVDDVGDIVTEVSSSGGTDLVQSSISFTLGSNVEQLMLTGSSAINGTGNSLANVLTGNSAANTLSGGTGADAMTGGAGADTYVVDNAGDSITEAAGEGADSVLSSVTHTLGANVESLTLTGSSAISGTGNSLDNSITGNGAANTLTGAVGNDTLDGGAGADTLVGGAGNETYVVDNTGDVVTELAGEGTDTVLAAVSYTLAAEIENLTLSGTLAINGTGNALNNSLVGNGAANTLSGGAGADVMSGGGGDDTYVVDDAADTITEAVGSGVDTVQAAVSYTLSANVENLTLTGTAAISGTGNAQDNVLTGNSAANVLTGGAGNDTYVVDNAGDVVTELAGGGVDGVQSSVTYTLSAEVENLTLTGTSAINATGNALGNSLVGNGAANTLTGAAGNDILDGAAGGDALVGGLGDDIYVVDSTSDIVTELTGEGTDTVRSSVTYTLGATLENLTLTGAAATNGTGNASNNILVGNTGNNTLDGGAGTDTMSGGMGNDTYVVDAAGDVVVELAGEGSDTVQTALAYTLGANLENVTLTGSGNVNATGNASANILTGNTGTNTLTGGAGDDTYVLQNSGDVVVELAGEGTDLVQSTVTYTLAANVENLTLTTTTAISGTGNSLSNVLTGNSANNTLTGGAGNDTYVIQNTGDVVVELAGEGTDLIQSSVTYTASANVENLTLTGTSAINATGNTLSNVLTGNSAANTLSGGTGADTMAGGAGNDIYVVDDVGDLVTELAGEGTDTVQTGLSYVLGANVENLTLTGTAAVSATGNTLNNVLTGNTAANVLTGGLGDDTYVVDNAGDQTIEQATEGVDLVQSSITCTLAANVENLTLTGSGVIHGTGNGLDNALTGNSAANTLTAGVGNDTLNGGGGADTMAGGAGDDSYTVDNVGDVVTEVSGEGVDTVTTALAYTLGNNVENLTLTGTSAVNGTGNTLDNVLTGNSAANTLTGGTGNDTYVIQNTTDIVTEAAGEGTDSVQSSVTYTLTANVENLTLTGTSAINGTGNALNNTLAGNSGANTLDGAAGADVMAGGGGNDTYLVDNVGDVITELASAGTDAVQSSVTFALSANVENLTLTGTAAIDATGNDSANTLTGNGGNNRLDGGAGSDSLVGGAGDDTYVVDATGDAVTEGASAGTDTVQASISYTLGSNVENLALSGTGALNGTGNTLNNSLVGNAGANILDGGTGADAMSGGAGDDTYVIDNAGDTVSESAGEGADTVQTALAYTLGSNVENLVLTGTGVVNGTGNTLNNTITGNSAVNTLNGGAGNDVLDGGSGSDTLMGGLGDDTYVFVTAGDVIVENAGEGIDTVQTTVNGYTLGANLENVSTTQFAVTGNALNNVITGNYLDNALDGGAGADALIGGSGDDTYVVDDAGDVVTENSSEGTDAIQASVSFTLGSNVENLTLTGTAAINATGNGLDNVLTGNAADNVLTGGLGNDTYVVNSAGDVVVELAGEGTDTVQSSVSFTLGATLENLTLTATGIGQGNDLDNILISNSTAGQIYGYGGNDLLDGGAMYGGVGNDTYVMNSMGESVHEEAGEGIDTLNSAYSGTLAANIEILFSTASSASGNVLNNLIRGASGANILDGGGGIDILEGGGGNDTISNTNALGNTLLSGGAGSDVLTGSVGNDLLIGGTGGDIIVSGTGADIIAFNLGDGSDVIAASSGADNTVSLGGGVTYADLIFEKVGSDLVLKVGASDQITFTGYYADGANRNVNKLQVVIEGTSDYDAGSGNSMNNKKVETFDFEGLVAAFGAAMDAQPGLTSWALTNALVTEYLSGSDTAALGGDLAYQYARNGSLANIAFTPALGILGAAGFGSSAQTLQSLPSLQDSTPRLS